MSNAMSMKAKIRNIAKARNIPAQVILQNYILATTQKYDKALFRQAMAATARHRGTAEQITDVDGILADITESTALRSMWEKYRRQFAYAKEITFEMILVVLDELCR